MGESPSSDSVVFDSRTPVRLELRPVRDFSDRAELPTWQARLIGDGLDCSVVFSEAGWVPRSLADLLLSISEDSEDWPGWDGERVWHSEGAEVQLAFRHDKVNTVLVAVAFEEWAPPWRCEAELELSPGVFSYLASEVRRLAQAPRCL
jgi:hypothetical protein